MGEHMEFKVDVMMMTVDGCSDHGWHTRVRQILQ